MNNTTTLKHFLALDNRMRLAICIGIMAFCTTEIQAQNSSYNANTVPIGGFNSCAFGSSVLTANTGSQNVGVGLQALRSNSSGRDNAAMGYRSLYSNTTGSYNVSVGSYALKANTTGRYNAAFGYQALYNNTTAENNTSVGFRSMYLNTTGADNTATGFSALYSNTSGRDNAAMGYQALFSNTTGSYNVSIGSYALNANTTGRYNAAFGYQVLYSNTTAENNTSVGFRSMYLNTTGANNTATGFAALSGNTTGMQNVANGYGALISNINGNCNTGIGDRTDVSNSNFTNATAIGCGTIVNAGNKVRIGNAAVTVVEGPVAYTVSDGRFKTDVKEDDVKGLEFIKRLRPVVYNFDTRKLTEFWTKNMPDSIRQRHMNYDFSAATRIRQSGFIAQEVEKAAQEARYDFNGVHTPVNSDDNYSLAYGQFVVPLVKGMQEQQKMIEEQQQTIRQLQQQVNDLLKKEQTATAIEQTLLSGALMEQNVPNPFSHETVIEFTLPQEVKSASMNIYDLSGKQLQTLLIDQRGASSVKLTADQLPAGMYLYSIIADGKPLDTKRMMVTK